MNSTECLICYEKIKNTNFCITECNHVYCLTCIIKATLRKTECPYCKYKLVEITEEEEEIDENIIQEVNVQVPAVSSSSSPAPTPTEKKTEKTPKQPKTAPAKSKPFTNNYILN